MKTEITTDLGIFGVYFDRGILMAPHFYIKCKCGMENNRYSDYRLEKEKPKDINHKREYTFYRSLETLISEIDYRGEKGEKLVLICNDCDREFIFTGRFFLSLLENITKNGVDAGINESGIKKLFEVKG